MLFFESFHNYINLDLILVDNKKSLLNSPWPKRKRKIMFLNLSPSCFLSLGVVIVHVCLVYLFFFHESFVVMALPHEIFLA
jgi:hypothetical protein